LTSGEPIQLSSLKLAKSSRFLKYVRMLRVLRLIRLVRTCKMLGRFSQKQVMGGPFLTAITGGFKLLIGIGFVVHAHACIWRSFSDFGTHARQYSIDPTMTFPSYKFAVWWTVQVMAGGTSPENPSPMKCGCQHLKCGCISGNAYCHRGFVPHLRKVQ